MNRHVVFAVFVVLASAVAVHGQGSRPAMVDTMADTWAATDALGRSLPSHEQVGPPRADRYVGAFYFLWLGQHGTAGPYDVTKILATQPGAMTQPSNPSWGPMHYPHFWGEPLFGYYLNDDAWVLRKHAQMLSDAGVDVIIFDVTNQVTYEKVYIRLCEVFTQVRRDGGRTPQIAFLTPFWDPSRVVGKLYVDLYKPGRFADLWFRWKGKPLILADPAKSPPETRDFFTFRKPQPDYFQGPTGPDQWAWLEIHPQHVFRDAAGKAEQMAVGVAQNGRHGRLSAFSEKDTYGRSWHDGRKDERPDAVAYGLNFAEQWERALNEDPEFIFVTNWNEWIAGRFAEFAGVREPVMFVDEYTQEYSRDVEPMKGGHGDNYYYQMIGYIRRFKGVRARQAAGGPATITIDGRFEDWRSVRPEYRDDAGDTMHRDHPGHDRVGRYTNNTGRNDMVAAKVAYDEKTVCFYVRTREPLTRWNDPHWMLLFIDGDRNPKTGWEGFDFVVSREVLSDSRTTLAAWTPSGSWQRKADVAYRAAGTELELTIPREVLGLQGSACPHLTFKWADNIQRDDVTEFTVSGDAAPNCRFVYAY